MVGLPIMQEGNVFYGKYRTGLKRVLFLDSCNHQEPIGNPLATLIVIPERVMLSDLKTIENNKLYIYGRTGGSWQDVMKDSGTEHLVLSSGQFSQYNKDEYDEMYTVISGNY